MRTGTSSQNESGLADGNWPQDRVQRRPRGASLNWGLVLPAALIVLGVVLLLGRISTRREVSSTGNTPPDGNLPMDRLHERAQKLLEQDLGAREPVFGCINGIDDTQCLVLTDQRAIIIKVGWRSGQTLGGKVTSFDYRSISSIEVRTSILTGTFEISSGGMQGAERSYWNGSKPDGAWRAPNTIPIRKKQQAMFQQVATFIRERTRFSAQDTAQRLSPTARDVPDQLRKLAELREQGVITDSEFEAKKADLLARL
jgi:hypothetical protein